MSQETLRKIDKVNKRLYGSATPKVMLKRYNRCITFDKKSELFLLKTTAPIGPFAKEKLVSYIRFWIEQCPELRMVRKTKIVVEKSGKLYIASCHISMTLR